MSGAKHFFAANGNLKFGGTSGYFESFAKIKTKTLKMMKNLEI